MILLRSILYFAFLVITTIVIATVGSLVAWALPQKQVHLFDTSWSRLNLWALKFFCGLTYRVTGLEHLPKDNCIIFAKHQSAWETIALISVIPGAKSWVLKRELLFVPFFGWIMVYFRPIAIDRKSGRKAVEQIVEQGIERLKSGNHVFVFPEGTRVAPGTRKRYGIGGAILAEKSAYPVLPVAHNAGVFWRRRDLRKYPGVIDVVIGPLIQTEGKSASQINQEAEEWIESTVDSLPHERS
ncbi:MAG: lysophospholipid acyltransferase family protein [Candidatus Thiodiazotropha taylori]|nr:1-acyl-sn-glycerol-3-phosphate acyltransferase [Candidatus Thiodiazotropha taylori]MCW4313061.1 1-acyl-sn-glycerol-3-phosphate acyltransferase [Candidatus Thiodiazotropha taylori]